MTALPPSQYRVVWRRRPTGWYAPGRSIRPYPGAPPVDPPPTGGTARDALVLGVDKPTENNTGHDPVNIAPLTITSSHSPVSGQAYANLEIRNRIDGFNKGNVTYRNCWFRGDSVSPTGTVGLVTLYRAHLRGWKFYDCSFSPLVRSPWWIGIVGYGFELIRCKIWGVVDPSETYLQAGTSAAGPLDVRFAQCLLYDHAFFPPPGSARALADPAAALINSSNTPSDGSHSDGIQWQGGDGMIVEGCTIRNTIQASDQPNNSGGTSGTAALMIFPDAQPISGGIIRKNWLSGGGVTVQVGDKPLKNRIITNVGQIDDNKFEGAQQFPPWDIILKPSTSQNTGWTQAGFTAGWTGNVKTYGGGAAAPWYSGASCVGANDGTFGTWRGRPLQIIGTWADSNVDVQVNGPQWALGSGSQYAAWNGPADIATGGIYTQAGGGDAGGDTWAKAAAGNYVSRWTASLNNLKAAWGARPYSNLYVRFAHEFNGDWSEWQVTPATAASFVLAWRRYADLAKSILPGCHLVWSPSNGTSGSSADVRQCWPGTGYADTVGLDYYNSFPTIRTQADWDGYLSDLTGRGEPLGPGAWLSQAASWGVQLGLSEWGSHLEDGDYPAFMVAIGAWVKANAGTGAGRIAYEIYYNLDGPGTLRSQLTPTTAGPLTAAQYKATFGPVPVVNAPAQITVTTQA